jgi:hypothetical protein
VTATAPAPGAPDAPAIGRLAGAAGQGWLQDLVRSAAAPVISAAVLAALLSAWVAAGGAGTVTLSPLGQDIVLTGTRGLTDGQQVPLTLVFRRAGRVTIMATVTAPGTP